MKRPEDIPMPEFRQISETIWEIPKSYKKGMNVPARIYATKKLLGAMDRGVFNQVTNVACLPGIVNHAFCMPDGHWGYGFPIGGVAAFDPEEGVISPGGIGFDINCLSGDTKILLKYGCYKKIRDFGKDFSKDLISFMDIETNRKKSTNAVMFMKKKPDNRVLRMTTVCGEELILTEDHPIYTDKNMVKAGELKEGNKVVIHPFGGVEYKEPSDEIIVDEINIVEVVGNRKNLIKNLKDRNLLPLKEETEKLPILAKLLGFFTGDAWLGKYYNKQKRRYVWSIRVIGKKEDLEEVRKDINSLGYKIGFIQEKRYESEIKSVDGNKRKIEGISCQLHINSQSFAVLMKALGMPEGNKSRTTVSVPMWVKNAPLWIKRLYLAGLFGAELSTPCQRKGENKSFIEPSFSQNKIIDMENDNYNFLAEISNLLGQFGVNINKIYRQKGVINKKGEETVKLSIRISSKLENLINLWGKIGYEYCKERKEHSMLALAYLKKKRRILKKTEDFLEEAGILANKGTKFKDIYTMAENRGLSSIMVKGQLYKRSKGLRISSGFPTFEEFSNAQKIDNSEFVMDEIEKIDEINYENYVYDFTMNDINHNFIANCVVSHNCGMRLITTNLTINDVKPKLRELVDVFFKTVPAGVGAKGFVKVKPSEFDEITVNGVKWCVDNGYGWKEDIERVEEYGRIKGANPDKVSDRAKKRGLGQLGTLGSGNHYLEVQLVQADRIFDGDLAKKFGIFENQIVVMIHCGSRGFGHQIGTDYLRIFGDAMKKYNIRVNDRELACAPFSSEEGQDYYAAMACAANMAFSNRQVILHRVREGFSKVFGQTPEELELKLIYDVAHNIAKVEEHVVDGKKKNLVVHRKGSTRSFPPNHSELADIYKETGQPVIIGGSMETGSFLLVGTEGAMNQTFGSTAHGSGRTMSRTKAKREIRGDSLQKNMEKRGIYVRAVSMPGLAEEAGIAYKDINDVIDAVSRAGISKPVVGLKPVGNVKG